MKFAWVVAFFMLMGQAPTPVPYSRARFGVDWADVDHDCQDTRAEILIARSLVPVTYTTSRNCRVKTGLWIDEYSGELIRNANETDIDHVVPLKEAYMMGASEWEPARRLAYANDPTVLAITSYSTNRSKGDKTPVKWVPSTPAAKCLYLFRWAGIKAAWGLRETDEERLVLHSCETTP